jgi:membrane protein YqaA with SNARE-associated domain
MAYWQLFFTSFTTNLIFFPWLKDFALTTMLLNGNYNSLIIYAVVVLATTIASISNYFIGWFLMICNNIYRIKSQQPAKTALKHKTLGYFFLPIGFLSIIGESISLLGGFLRLNFARFLLINVAIRLIFFYLLIFKNINIDFLEKF